MSYNPITYEILTQQEERLTNAEKMGDAAALEELLSNDFAGINLHGQKIDRNTFISGNCNPDLKFGKLEISELLFKQIDSVGIVIGKTSFEATFEGKPIKGHTRFMDIWERYNDRTLLVSSAVIREESPAL